MNWLLAIQLIPTIIKLMEIAERLLGPNTGEQKKEFVKEGVKAITSGMVSVSTGGQKETWTIIETIMEPIGDLIDRFASLLFPNES